MPPEAVIPAFANTTSTPSGRLILSLILPVSRAMLAGFLA